jgi:hypothetical protein
MHNKKKNTSRVPLKKLAKRIAVSMFFKKPNAETNRLIYF